ncbi:conserved hypothetical protein [Desulfosarcina cetonica]|uniref:phage tail protein n=1 Tax=Desulfosarcina cetonica TaxID=90730 RepID=UPI0006D1484A|nr:phage tail protein [Desulfosarcina cetonica]VTR66759.1 conserved hypothetical protein [Desulfosarcina cetonica]
MLVVKSNIKEFSRWMNKVEKKQLPYATALALTRTAQDVQSYIQDAISGIFNVTKKWWLKKQPTGIKIKSAKKTDKNMFSRIYTEAYFADLQEDGGVKKPHKGRALLIPTNKTPKYGRKSGGHIKILNDSKTLSKGKNGSRFFEMESGFVGVFKRRGKKRLPIDAMYHVVGSANIKPRFGFKRMAERVAIQRFSKRFAEALAKALRTAR